MPAKRPAIQFLRAEYDSLGLPMPVNPYNIEIGVLARETPHYRRAAHTLKWLAPCKMVTVRYARYRLRVQDGKELRANTHTR